MAALAGIGGLTPLMKMLLDQGLLHGDCLTVTGKTMAENLKSVKPYPKDQDIIHGFDNPIKPTSHLVVFYGNLAPLGGIGKITGKEGEKFQGTARCFDSEEDCLKAVLGRQDQEGRRDRDSLRRAEGRARHARNALADVGDHGPRPGR